MTTETVQPFDNLRNLRFGTRQRKLLAGASIDGWCPVVGDRESTSVSCLYEAAHKLRDRGLVVIVPGVLAGQRRLGVTLTVLGRAVVKRYAKQIMVGGRVQTWALRKSLRAEYEARAA